MRHRAAVGITESTDAVVLVVSEQRGMVSLVSDGKVFPSTEKKALLKQLYYLFDITLDEFSEIKTNGVKNGI
jgi:DNA integrity scanning protein DisA with diadenylate cyclase activity